ncbi:hypothetical protein BaRGS_00005488 [Batillaria attramentaria]|uniref:Apple domain-containing protein n=1 Tax=Batillaria attramentaria TaxID=370345 RepID=A0ABD0LVS4_9CAEN
MTGKILLVFALVCSASEVKERTGQRDGNLADLIFAGDLLFTFNARSTLECAVQCFSVQGCLTYTYIRLASKSTSCRGHTSVMTYERPHESAPGSSYYSFACEPSNLQAEFLFYQNARVLDSNIYVYRDVSLDECKELCVSEAQCRTIEYKSNESKVRCNMAAVTALNTSVVWEPDSNHGYDYYQRACA